MYRKELNERNPLRLFEHSIHGGLGPGNVGVVVACHGIGKTAFLVGIALDDAMRGRKILHVSLDKTVDHMREFYVEILLAIPILPTPVQLALVWHHIETTTMTL